MNRFDNGSVSVYNPQSFEELAFVPMMKRKQHDELLAKQELIKSKLLEVDPLDVHLNEASMLQKQMNDEIDKVSSELSSKGINNDMISKTISLNRKYQDLVSPTGRIGQINNAKKTYNEELKNYIEDATKNKGFSREDALYNWQLHHNKYTGYDESKNIKNIDSFGAPKRIVLQEDLKTVKSLLGEDTRTLMKNNNFSFQAGPNGSIIVVDGKGKLVETSNIPQLKEASQYLQSRWLNPTGEGTMSANFERIDPNRLVNEINNGLGMMKTYKLDDSREDDYSIQGYTSPTKEKKEKTSSVVGIPIDVVEVGAKVTDYDELDKIGTVINNSLPIDPKDTAQNKEFIRRNNAKSGKTFSHKDIENPYIKKKYIATYNRLRASKEIPNTIGADDPRAVALIKNKMKADGPITLSSNIITTDIDLNSMGFPGMRIGKDSKERTLAVTSDLRIGTRRFIDPKSGKEMTWNQMKEAGYNMKTISYYGFMSPHSWDETKFGAKNKNVSQHKIVIEDDKGNVFPTEISRTSKDGSQKDIKASYDMRKTYQAATLEPNEFVSFKSDLPSLKNAKVAYVTKDQYGQVLQEPVFTVKIGDKQGTFSEAEYMQIIYSMYNK